MPRFARGKPIFLRFARRPPLSDGVFGVFVQRTGCAAFPLRQRLPYQGSCRATARLRGCTKVSLTVSRSGTEPLRHACGVPPPLSRGGTGVSVRPTRDEQSLLYPKTVVPCYRGQQLRDNIPCQAAVNLCSRALSFTLYQASGVQHKTARHAKGSPSGRAVTKGD